MFRWRRQPLQEFPPEEYLFQRWPELGYDEGDTSSPERLRQRLSELIRVDEQSVNRERFGRAVDVLFPDWCTWGVFGYTRGALPSAVPIKETKRRNAEWSMAVEHEPDWYNYAHSNVYVIKNGGRVRRASDAARKALRERIASNRSTRLFRSPSPGVSKLLAWLRCRLGR